MFLAVLDLGIDLDVWPWIWLTIAVLFALIEITVVGGSFIILPWAISAFVTSVLAFYDVPIEVQWAVFVFGGAAAFAGLYRWAQKFMREHPMDPGVGADRLVGLTGIVTAAIHPEDTSRRGRISVQGEVWGVVDPTRAYEPGEKVRIMGMKGTRVIVEPVESAVEPDPGHPNESQDN